MISLQLIKKKKKKEAGRPSLDAVNSYNFLSSCQSSYSCKHCPDFLLLWPHHGSDPDCLWLLVTQSWSKARPSVQLQKSRCCQTMHFSCCGPWRVTRSIGQWVKHKLLSLWCMRCFLGTSFLTRLAPPMTVRGSATLFPVPGWLRPLSPSPMDISRASLFTSSQSCLWWNSCPIIGISFPIIKFNVHICML